MIELLAQILSIVIFIWVIIYGQFKSMTAVIIGNLIVNVMICLQYALLGGWNGSFVTLLALVITLVSFILNLKGKTFPKWLTALFVCACVGLGFYSLLTTTEFPVKPITEFCIRVLDPSGKTTWLPRAFFNFSVILTMAGSTFYTLSVSVADPAIYRKYVLFSTIPWMIYDIYIFSANILTHIFFSISIIVAMIRYDRKKEKVEQK